MDKLIITVKNIKGTCPVYNPRDKIVLDDGYRFNLQETDHVCMHSLCAIMPYYVALFRGIEPQQLGLCQDGQKAYVQCLDPCEYTGGGTVVFEISRLLVD